MPIDSRPMSLCFDLDGTLVDTAPDLVRVLNLVTAERGLPPSDYEIARKGVGYGAGYLIRTAYASFGEELDETTLKACIDRFLELYAADIAALSQPYPGVEATLARLKAKGHCFAVCTNKPGWLARPLLDALGMTHWFARIIGSGDGVPSKPRPEMIYAGAGHKDTRRIIMVGDSQPDILAARAAKVPSVIVSYGYTEIPPSRLRADMLIRKFSELEFAVENISG